MSQWASFPHDNAAYCYEADELIAIWDELHSGDRVTLPGAAWVDEYNARLPAAARAAGNGAAISQALLSAWRAFHKGDFSAAVEQADEIGILAHAIANKAAGIYADYLEDDEAQQKTIYQQIVDRAEQAKELLPEDPNSHYFHAYGLGRYSQSISITKALSQGLGGKVRQSLEATLDLNPEHAEAHLAMGLFHAEIINKVGKLVGGMTYGANIDESKKHFQQALALAPNLPIIHIEYGNGIYLLHGDKKIDEMTRAYEQAVALAPRDAMQHLDRDFAVSELET